MTMKMWRLAQQQHTIASSTEDISNYRVTLLYGEHNTNNPESRNLNYRGD